MPYLIRTFTLDTPSVGSIISAPKGASYPDVFDDDTGVTFPQEGMPKINTGPYSAHAAVGYADPLFSLFPVSSDFVNQYSGGGPDIAAKRLIAQFGDYYGGLPRMLKQGNLRSAISYADDYLASFDNDNWGNFAMAELPEDFPLKEKDKYVRLLRNLRVYGPHSRGGSVEHLLNDPEYDRPQHALIEAEIEDIQKAKDKISKYSAENDGPNEFRVSRYTTKGLWTPRHVDNIIKKYFPDYTPGEVQHLKDNDRAKDALQEIIQHDADEIISDRQCKDILYQMNSQLNSFSIGNIANAIKEIM